MKQLFFASTGFQVLTLAAAISAGEMDRPAWPAAALDRHARSRPIVDERILVVSNHAQVLELSRPLHSNPALTPALARFDRIVDLNATLHPHHPTSWRPSDTSLPLLEAALRSEWGLGSGELELVVESPQVNPAIAMCRVFASSFVRVYSDGLMTYGPTRSAIALTNGQRMTALHHLPFVEGLTPRLLTEFDLDIRPIPAEAFTAVVAEVVAGQQDELDSLLTGLEGAHTALGVGQYLSALGLLTAREEEQLHVDMLEASARAGLTTFAFKPHPAAPAAQLGELEAAGARLGVTVRVLETPLPAEALVARLRPALVVGAFSTALATARAFFDTPIAVVGTALLLETVTPFQNSNRIPVTLMHELGQVDGVMSEDRQRELQALVDAVGYAMQPELLRRHRAGAADLLASPAGERKLMHFKRRRLTKLGLPQGIEHARTPRARAELRRTLRAASAFSRIHAVRLLSERRRAGVRA